MSAAGSHGGFSVGTDSDGIGVVRLHSYERGLSAVPAGDVDYSDSDGDTEVFTGLGGMGGLGGSLVGVALGPARSPVRCDSKHGGSAAGEHSHGAGGGHGHSHGGGQHSAPDSYASLDHGDGSGADERAAKVRWCGWRLWAC